MKCPLCKGEMVKGKTDLPYPLGKKELIVIQDVPAFVCNQCGDAFVEMEAAQKAEEILSTAQRDGVTLGFIHYREAA
ncbi:MAG: type II toxin-antitoxin system MqsA family antitoxin [Deltaproteobacteria bacterium]|nr:type II toxin-antitoxin system MqsA family antitoxin [Deltaproteobacteria bacterium]